MSVEWIDVTPKPRFFEIVIKGKDIAVWEKRIQEWMKSDYPVVVNLDGRSVEIEKICFRSKPRQRWILHVKED